jgi:hypothetical protein
MAALANSSGMEGYFKLAIWTALYCVPLIPTLSSHLDPDVWWHLRTGQQVVSERHVPATDSFSRHGLETGKPWLAYSWLFEIVLLGFYRLLGFSGIMLFRLLMVLGVAVALHRLIARREPRFIVAAALFAVAMFGLGPLLTERPWLFTILFSAITLDVVLDLREGKRSWLVWCLPLMFALWANLHIQFIYGLFMLGLACAVPVLDRSLRRPVLENSCCQAGSRAWWSLVLLTTVCSLATLINPYHVRLIGVVLEYGSHSAPLDYISELRPLEFRSLRDFVMPALAGAALFCLGRRQQTSCFEVMLLIAAAWFSFRSRRDLWFMTLVASGIVASSGLGEGPVMTFAPSRRQGIALAGILGLFLLVGWNLKLRPATIDSQRTQDYPVEAVQFVKSAGYRGPLYNSFDWGGYLIWDLPDLPVAMDGRCNLHGDSRLGQSYVSWNSLPGWDQDPDLVSSELVIADVSAPLYASLRVDHRFKLVFEDSRAAVFEVRGTAAEFAKR